MRDAPYVYIHIIHAMVRSSLARRMKRRLQGRRPAVMRGMKNSADEVDGCASVEFYTRKWKIL